MNLMKKCFPKIKEKINLPSFIFSILLGLTFSWLGKDTITQALFLGKEFEERSFFLKIILLSLYITLLTIVFYFLTLKIGNTLILQIYKVLRIVYETIAQKRKLVNFLFIGILVISIGLTIIQMLYNLSSNIFYDETLYLTHMRLIMMGNIPYHDFFDWVPPVWLYLYVFFFNLFGANIVVARTLSTIFGMSSIFLLVRLSWKLFGRWPALITLSLVACINPIVHELVRYYYTSSAFFFLILAISIEEALPKTNWKVIFVELLLVLAAGTVQAFGLILILYPLYQFFIIKDTKKFFLALLAGLLFGLAIALPFLFYDLEATLWAMFSYNREIIPMRWHYSAKIYRDYYLNSILTYGSVWFPIIAGIGYGIWKKFIKHKPIINSGEGKQKINVFLWFVLFGIAFPVFFFNPVLSMQQHVYYLPIACILTANLLYKGIYSIKAEWKMASIIILVFLLVYSVIPAITNIDLDYKQASILSGPDDLNRIISTTKRLTKDIPAAKVFTLVPYFGLEAGASIFPGTEYGITSLSLSWDTQKAKRFNFFTGSQALFWIKTGQPDLIIFVDKSSRTMECCGPSNGISFLNHFEETVLLNYTLTDSFYVNSYWGEARFFMRKR